MTEVQKKELVAFTDGNTTYNFIFDGQTIWLTRAQIGNLFDTTTDNVRIHVRNIYSQKELVESSTTKKIFGVVENRPNYGIDHYNLDVVIAVGYRVNSKVATKFRQWSTQVLSERILGGGVDQRLAHDVQRALIFKRVSLANDELHQTAIQMGVVALPEFFDVGYQGLYTNRLRALQKHKGIGADMPLNRAGPEELALNEVRITQTNSIIKRQMEEGKLVGQGVAFTTHFNVGRELRDTVKRIGGTLPEDIPAEDDHINTVQQRLADMSPNKELNP